MNIWFTSDTHFGHSNFLKFTDEHGNIIRPFASVEEMDEYMIEKWNSVVKPGDRIYHCGDVAFDYNNFATIAPRLHGSKRLIVGNHDDIPLLVKSGWFKKIQLWRIFKDDGFIASHIPLPHSQFRYKIPLNVHGHIHQQIIFEGGKTHTITSGNAFHVPLIPIDRSYYNVSVELHDYTPVHIDTIKQQIRILNENVSN